MTRLTEGKRKEFWEIVERILKTLPPGAADICRQVAQEVLDSDGAVDDQELTKRFQESFQKALETSKPIKTIKLSPKCRAQVKADRSWVDARMKESDAIKEKLLELNDRVDALKRQVSVRRESLNALILLEHGISKRTHAFRINDKTMEIEIMVDGKKVDDAMEAERRKLEK